MPETPTLRDRDEWAELLAVLAVCTRQPDEELREDIEDGSLDRVIRDLTEALGVEISRDPVAPRTTGSGSLTEVYLGLFEALQTPYAPIAESPYKRWYGGRTGLMDGPPAEDMMRRYAVLDAEFPDPYPADHLALLLEYGVVLLDAAADAEFEEFVDDHLDWIPALRAATESARATAPFHRWVVAIVDDVHTELRARLDLDPIDAGTVETMLERLHQEPREVKHA